jgi:D-alanyl-D-alanine carboxypeptidase
MGRSGRRTAAVGGAIALVGAVGVSAATAAPRMSPAPHAGARPAAGASAIPSLTPIPRTPTALISASVASPALTTRGHLHTRLTLAVTPGAVLRVVGVLTRAANGAPAVRRPVQVWIRTGDTGRWVLATTARTSRTGRVTYRLRDRPLLQVTLRFHGDRRFLPAASVTLVPDPSASGMKRGLVRALARARAAAGRAGLTLVVNSAYRSFDTQTRMYRAAVRRYGSARIARRWVLPAQESTHVRGLAADIGTPATAAWLNRHGAAFGLCRAYGDEPWHFEYRPDWVAAYHGRCPAPVPLPGDPGPLSPTPRVAVFF